MIIYSDLVISKLISVLEGSLAAYTQENWVYGIGVVERGIREHKAEQARRASEEAELDSALRA